MRLRGVEYPSGEYAIRIMIVLIARCMRIDNQSSCNRIRTFSDEFEFKQSHGLMVFSVRQILQHQRVPSGRDLNKSVRLWKENSFFQKEESTNKSQCVHRLPSSYENNSHDIRRNSSQK